MPTGAFKLGANKGPQPKRRDYKPLGTCVVCGGVELEIDKNKKCHLCKGDTKRDGVVPAFKTNGEPEKEDDTLYIN